MCVNFVKDNIVVVVFNITNYGYLQRCAKNTPVLELYICSQHATCTLIADYNTVVNPQLLLAVDENRVGDEEPSLDKGEFQKLAELLLLGIGERPHRRVGAALGGCSIGWSSGCSIG